MLDDGRRDQPAHEPHPARSDGRLQQLPNPALLAKITSTVDVVSGGRLDWGIGAGWYENEYRGYGYEFPARRTGSACSRDRRDRASDVDGAGDDLQGRLLPDVVTANCDPKPLQDPHPPIWIGGGGEQLTLRVVARHADCSNFGGTEQWAHKREVLQRHCRGVARRPTIRMTWSPRCSSADRGGDRRGGSAASGASRRAWRAGNLVGTPEQVAEKIETYLDLGCPGFVPWCSITPTPNPCTNCWRQR